MNVTAFLCDAATGRCLAIHSGPTMEILASVVGEGQVLLEFDPEKGNPTDWRTALEDEEIIFVPRVIDPAIELSLEKGKVKRAVEAAMNAHLTSGYTVVSGTMAGKVLQTRNETDKSNWTASALYYQAQISAGNGAIEGAYFRAEDNSEFVLTFNEGLQVILAMGAWAQAIQSYSWSLKNAIDAAEDTSSLSAIDIDTGWAAIIAALSAAPSTED